MAEAKLNFDEEILSTQGALYDLYSKLYNGMVVAQNVDSPSYDTNPPLTDEGEVDLAKINEALTSYSEILMKNSAYLFANSIISVIKAGGSGGSSEGGLGYVSRSGDFMTGLLGALYGFQAGYNGTTIFQTSYDLLNNPVAYLTGIFKITGDTTIDGKLTVANTGIWFGEHQAIYYDNSVLKISNEDIGIDGNVKVDGSISVGDVIINKTGITWGDYNFYHSGNSNKKDVDWTMKDAYVAGNIYLDGDMRLDGTIYGKKGFDFYYENRHLIYTESQAIVDEYDEPVYDDDGNQTYKAWITLQSDLHILSGYGLTIDDDYILKVRDGANGVISLSAPNRVLNLGDSDGNKLTKYISLQASIKNYNGDYTIVSQYGDGNFPNSFSAGTGNAGSTAIQTYYLSADDQGLVMYKNVRFNTSRGPRLFSTKDEALQGELPYIVASGDGTEYKPLGFQLEYLQTTSLFRDQSKEWSASLHISTDSEFFTFDNPVEGASFSIKSEQYKTRLIENALFLNDGAFLEGLTDGIRYAGNAYFDDDLSSQRFASGFAGYGWAIMQDKATGNIAATFDELTLRKKLRAYELEIQKISATNGSLWVSDSCSGDEVRIIE